MLFDLRGRGRRRTIQAIYLFLAILLGGGLIFFGIGGGGGGGGLLNAVGQNGTNGSGTDVFASNVKAAEKRVAAAPKDPAAWVALEHARFQVAGTGKNFDQTSGTFTSAGKAQLQQVKAAWDRYLALKPKTPSSDAAKEMVQALGPAGLNQIPAAVRRIAINEVYNVITSWQVAGDNRLRARRSGFYRSSIDTGLPAREPELQQLGFACC